MTTSPTPELSPLAGLHVVETGSFISVPFAALMLADLGARVTKVEPPRGDPYRRFGPMDEAGSPMFRSINRNKTSVVIDLKTTEGQDRLFGVLDSADALLSNWRPSVAGRIGLTDDVVRTRWPSLVWVRVSGYGQDGPAAAMPAFDSVIQARTGIVAARGAGEPELQPMYTVDKVAALTAANTMLAGLLMRATTGRGTIADVAMLDAAAYFNAPDLSAGHQVVGTTDERIARHLRTPRPLKTQDGAVVISPVTGRQMKSALTAAGLEDQVAELKQIADPARLAERLYSALEPVVIGDTTANWLDRLARADVPATAVLDIDEHIEDPQVIHNRFYRVVEEPDGRRGRRPRHPALFDGAPVATSDLPSPGLVPPSTG